MKKILSIILVLIQLLSFTAFADSNELSDVQKKDLYNLGIMIGDENGDLRLEDNITRAEATKMICIAGNIRLSSEIDRTLFNDVEGSHWAYKYISAAKENGIINGDENGNFNPENNITNEEIAKMIVCLLGYGEMSEMNGGYPAGYTATASRLGITTGLNLKTKTPAIRRDVAVIISNALDIPLMENVDEGEYIVLDGNNFMPRKTLRNDILSK